MPFGLFQFRQMPFSLKNAAQTFQRMMDNVTHRLPGLFVYLGDILVASATPAQHEQHLRQLFHALKTLLIGAQTSPKCIFGARKLEFLRHSVSSKGIQPLPEKVEAVQVLRAPALSEIPPALPGIGQFLSKIPPQYSGNNAAPH